MEKRTNTPLAPPRTPARRSHLGRLRINCARAGMSPRLFSQWPAILKAMGEGFTLALRLERM